MAEALVRNESPAEYFRELVESAMHRQHLSARECTSFYLVNLLTGFVHVDRSAPPATTSRSACASRRRCRKPARGSATGSAKSAIDRCSSRASSPTASTAASSTSTTTFSSASARTGRWRDRVTARSATCSTNWPASSPAFVDVLGEVSERTALTSNADLLRLYEKWLRTRSRRSGDLLASRGIVPNASIGSRFIQ